MSLQNLSDIEEALRSGGLSIRDLHSIWERRQPVFDPRKRTDRSAQAVEFRQIPWLQSHLVREFTARALEKEEFLLVCDAAREALQLWPGANEYERTDLVRVCLDFAAALTRLGLTQEARRQLDPCAGADFQPRLGRKLKVEILLQLGDILREESHHAAARESRLQLAEEALGFYHRALEFEPHGLKPLILIAAASCILGAQRPAFAAQARDRARQIMTLTHQIEESDGPRVETTWGRAIAQTILGDRDAAARSYGELATLDSATTAILAEARYRAQFLAEALGEPRDYFKAAFPPLRLIVFSGHLPDLPNQPARFPPESIGAVRSLLQTKLEAEDVRMGLAAAAAGADLLFIEAMRARKGLVHLVLPWSEAEFRQTSVRPYEPNGQAPIWEPLFDTALEHAATVREIGQLYEPGSDVGWNYMMEVTAGLALRTARIARLDVQPMALWDGLPGRGSGGTESFVDFWQRHLGREPIILEMPRISETPIRPVDPRRGRCERATIRQEVKSMLFADIVGYSKLTEQAIPAFVGTFLERVSQLAATSRHAPRSLNTWGDAVYAVFDFTHEAGAFALELIRMIEDGKEDWLQKGLYWEEHTDGAAEPVKHPLNIRIGLHSGPIFLHYDPIVRRLGYTGAHVNRAARLEPVAQPGEVFASEEFAALAELGSEIDHRDATQGAGEAGLGFACQYAGTMQLAKAYPGRHRIYRLVPRRDLAIEALAKAAHQAYCEAAAKRGATAATNSALHPWESLDETYREANRAQVADVPVKLRQLGYELTLDHGLPAAGIVMSDRQVEELAIREHQRWMDERDGQGWTYAPKRDNARKHHPLIVPWEQLSEAARQVDRDAVRNLPRLVEQAGFYVRKIAEPSVPR